MNSLSENLSSNNKISQKNNTVNTNNLKKSKSNTKTKSQNKADNTHKTKKTDEASRTDKSASKSVTSSAKKNVSQKSKTVNTNKLEKPDNDAKFSIDPEFEAKYDRWDKENPNKVFVLGKTSNALKSIGLNDKFITMDSGKIIKIKNKHHNMTDEVIKNIPKILENPVAIMKSKTKSNRITMFGSLTDANGKPVLAVLELSPIRDGYRLNEYKVASAYGKDNLQNLINTSEMLYVDNKKRTTNLSNEFGLQLPLSFDKSSSSDSIISKDNTNVNNSIYENTDNDTKSESKNKADVKKSAEEFSKVLGVKINVYESDSSIRGYYQNGEIFINESWVNKKANSESEFNYILAHELTHSLEESKHYNQLKEFILDSRIYDDSLKSRDTTHTEEVTKRQELYEKYGKELTTEQAEQELIADFIADELLTNEESIKELAYKDKKLFVKVKEFVNKLIERIKNFSNKSSDITQAQKDLIHIKELYNKAFKDVKENGTYSNEIKYSKKLGGYNPEILVSTKDINVFNINNVNDLSEVKSKVYDYLLNKYISTVEQAKPITNIDTGMKIEIWRNGINETFGNAKAYKNLTAQMKKAKLATMTNLAKMIKYGEVRSAEAKNYHNPNSKVTFAYLTHPITIDGIKYNIEMDIRKTRQGSRFYIHKIKIADEAPRTDKSAFKLNTSSANNNISQKNSIVNDSILENSDNDTKTESQKELREFINENYDVLKKAYDIMEKFNALENEQNNGSDSGNSVDNQGESGIIKSLDVDDFIMMAESNEILPEVSSTIANTIKEFENKGGMYISDMHFGDFYDEFTGKSALLQIVPNGNGLIDININSEILKGKSHSDIDKMISKTKTNLPENLTEAVIHECGHAKAYYGKSIEDIKLMNEQIKNCGVDGISRIAKLDGAECIAEVEVLLYRGEPVPEKALELYNKYVGGKRR